jgi:predicted DNA-binding ArsR family transcriptional regulator
MIQIEQKEQKKSNLADKLPKLGKISQLILLIGIFAIVFVPLIVINQQQPSEQAELKGTLSNLEKISSAAPEKHEELNAQIEKINAEIKAANELYPSTDQIFNIIDTLIELALIDDITVDSIKVEEKKDNDNLSDTASITFVMDLTGQVPKFQNYILSLDSRFPTSEIRRVNMTIAQEEETEDSAFIELDIHGKKNN